MSGIALILIFLVAIIIMIYMIAKWKVHPFLALMSISIALALVAGLPLAKIPTIVGEGFSNTFKSIGIVIIFGAIIGTILEKTGAALKLADMVVKVVGQKRPELAMLIMGWVVGIPVFCDSGFVVLNPIREAIRKKILANPVGMAVALSAGLYASHVFIPPTPGPIAAAGAVGLSHNLLLVIGMGFVVSIPVLIASYFFAKYVGKQVSVMEEAQADQVISQSYEDLIKQYGKLPSGFLSFAPIFMPIILMAIGSIAKIAGVSGDFGVFLQFVGNPIIALAIGVIFAIFLLVSSGKMAEFDSLTNDTLKLVGPILFITAAGGVLGNVITQAGFVDYIKQNAHIISTAGIFFPFLISAILKTAQGSSTVAIITTASIMGMFNAPDSLMNALGLTSEMAAALTVMAIAAGSMCVSHANDSYYWVVTNFTKLTPQQGYRTQTTLTFIMGVVGMLTVYLLSLILL
ncbi:TPA: GntP family permease [Mannheimia haemolytica]|uniref:GntP family permease n=2 Tax=Mannheimia haemolytica TaxID=75985 RepID=A0A547EL12_MANHA|nr:GntP family permease [Mannheimia haemolytica]AWW70421.1 GntP family permease [Pasteurellaceae bacterium 12565]AGI31447.2 gluconate transporter [Mannheimia haemolytica USDA-ARS-USMARC-183]AGI36444.2 gluconate transporter [Mannheimia haemolytica USDA-ARS-USMARC-185]AGK00911.1 gluconate transporter GntT [Mannheimia haemolytica M42548]AGQ26012.1 GntP protein [Mannheimia haemolytica D153]